MQDNIIIKEEHIMNKNVISLLELYNKELSKILGYNSFKAISNDGVLFIAVLYHNDIPIAMGTLKHLATEVAQVIDVYSKDNNIGAAHKLIEYIEKRAFEMGYDQILVSSNKRNEKALEFFISLKYKLCNNYGKYVGRKDIVSFNKNIKNNY